MLDDQVVAIRNRLRNTAIVGVNSVAIPVTGVPASPALMLSTGVSWQDLRQARLHALDHLAGNGSPHRR